MGVPQQKYWEVVVVTGKAASSQASPNSHAGVSTLYTMDASGKMVKRGTVDRVCTGTTYYRIGWPGQGPGKIARVMSWNKVLGVDEIQSVANSMTNCKKTTSPCQTKLISGANFDLNAAAQTSDIPKDSKVGMTFAKKAVKKDGTVPYWDLDKSFLQRTGGGTLKDGQFYTHAFLMKWRATNSGWRTLFRHNQDHCILVRSGTTDLGMYSNRNGAFRDSKYNIVPQNKFWEVVLVTGKGSSATSHTGVSTLYTLDGSSGKMVKRGTVDRVCTGTSYYRIGWPGQGPGKIARALSWNRVLGMDEIQAVATTLTTCKADPKACSKNNGGCHSARKCMATSSGVTCGVCPDGWDNDGPTGCKKAAPDKPLGKCETSTTRAAVFDLNAAAQIGDSPKDSIAKMIFANKPVKKDDSLPYWDLSNSYLQRTGG